MVNTSAWAHAILLALFAAVGTSPAAAALETSSSSIVGSGVADDASTRAGSKVPPVPQYNIFFGKCGNNLQQARYGNWVLSRPRSKQSAGSMLFVLDTKNSTPIAEVFGKVDPLYFPIMYLYFAYWDPKAGVLLWSPQLEKTGYKETRPQYTIRVNGQALATVRDLKDRGTRTNISTAFSLKGRLNGTITPSPEPYTIEVVKWCSGGMDAVACALIPDPAKVFTSPRGHVVWSAWSVGQALTVNGRRVQDHAWCPVQVAVDTK